MRARKNVHYAGWPAAALVAAASLATSAEAQTANTIAANVNTLNLLSPFLGLNATTTGQNTLTQNLNSSVAVNNNAAGSPTIEMTSISDKSLMGGTSTTITLANGTTATYGPGANLAGGLPQQAVQNATTNGVTTYGTVTPYQQYGGLGQLGTAFQAAVSPGGAAVPSVVTLLTSAYNATSSDLGVAKNYFANGTTNGTTTAVAPAGYTLPTFNGLPNKTNSVYDVAYGVNNTQAGQGTYGDSRPVQVAPSRFNGYDPNALTGLATNPSFPSGHTTYAYTDSILTGMLVPQNFQSMLLRASEYGNSRIDLGVHYPLDIIASRSFVQFDLAQMLAGSPNYTASNTQANFVAAQPALTSYLTTQAAGTCGTLQACANSNPYNAYSVSTYGANTPTANATLTSNSQIYQARLAYGLPTLTFAAAPAEAAPAGGPDASILLATLYGGSSAGAKAIAPNGGLYGSLSSGTVNQMISNTEGPALAAFYGTALSYWSRIDLYDAAGYFGNVNGTLTLASGDQVSTNVTVANGGALRGPGATVGTAASNNSVTVQSGGLLSPGVAGEAAGSTMRVNGALTVQQGGTLQFLAAGSTAGLYDQLVVSGLATLSGLLDFELSNGFRLPYGLSNYAVLDFGSESGDFTGLMFNNNACTAAGSDMWQCGGDVVIDEVFGANSLSLQVASVPEPASLALFGTAVAGFLGFRRRRSAAA